MEKKKIALARNGNSYKEFYFSCSTFSKCVEPLTHFFCASLC